MDEVKLALRPGDVVLLDNNLNDRRTEYARPLGRGVDVPGHAATSWSSTGCRTRLPTSTRRRWPTIAGRGKPVWWSSAPASTARTRQISAELIEQFGLIGLDGKPARPPRPADRYGLYRFDPAARPGSR